MPDVDVMGLLPLYKLGTIHVILQILTKLLVKNRTVLHLACSARVKNNSEIYD